MNAKSSPAGEENRFIDFSLPSFCTEKASDVFYSKRHLVKVTSFETLCRLCTVLAAGHEFRGNIFKFLKLFLI